MASFTCCIGWIPPYESDEEEKREGMSITNLITWIAFLVTVVTVVYIAWGG